MSRPQRYRRRLPECEAILYTGDNAAEVAEWCGGRAEPQKRGEETVVLVLMGQSIMPARPGDYVVKEAVPREFPRFYPIKGELFEYTHERILGED